MYKKYSWPIACHGIEQCKIICDPSHVTGEGTVQNYLCSVICDLGNESTKFFFLPPVPYHIADKIKK